MPAEPSRFPVCVHYYTRDFGEDRWAIHYYAAIEGHESGDRFMQAAEINDLCEQESPAGRLYVKLREMGLEAEREWMVNEGGVSHTVQKLRDLVMRGGNFKVKTGRIYGIMKDR